MAVAESPTIVELDTNVIIELARRGSGERRAEALLRGGGLLQISAVAWSEFLCGPLDAADIRDARRFLSSVEPFTEEDAELSSELFNSTGRRPRSHADCMIAAHAIRRDAALATLNARDFRRFEKFNLKLAWV